MFFFCPNGITPNSGLTGPNNTYTYIHIYRMCVIVCNYYICKCKLLSCAINDLEFSPLIRETWVQSQVASHQTLLKWHLPPCLKLSNIRYVSRLKLSNPGKGVRPSPTPRCSSYWKGSLLVALDYGHQIYLLDLHLSGRRTTKYKTIL